jgi:hypothetical protein
MIPAYRVPVFSMSYHLQKHAIASQSKGGLVMVPRGNVTGARPRQTGSIRSSA